MNGRSPRAITSRIRAWRRPGVVAVGRIRRDQARRAAHSVRRDHVQLDIDLVQLVPARRAWSRALLLSPERPGGRRLLNRRLDLAELRRGGGGTRRPDEAERREERQDDQGRTRFEVEREVHCAATLNTTSLPDELHRSCVRAGARQQSNLRAPATADGRRRIRLAWLAAPVRSTEPGGVYVPSVPLAGQARRRLDDDVTAARARN